MKITDKEVKKIVRYINMAELTESIESFPEEEKKGKTDIEVLESEIEWFLEWGYLDEGTIYYEDLERSREILRETNNGKFIPLNYEGSSLPKYQNWQIQNAKDTVSEFKRLKRGKEKLNALRRSREEA